VKLGVKGNGLGWPFKPKKSTVFGLTIPASKVHLPSSPPLFTLPVCEDCVGSGAGVEASVLSLVMENSQDKVAGEGFGAGDGAAGVASLPVIGSTLLVTSEVCVVPSSDFGLLVVNIAEISSTMMIVSATPAITPLIPERIKAAELVSGLLEVFVAGLELLGIRDPGESFVQGRGGGSVGAGVGFGSVSVARQLSQVSYPDFPFPWEDNLSLSPSSRVREGSVSGEVVSVVLLGSEESLAKFICGSSQDKSVQNSSSRKSLIKCGFFGPRAASAPTSSAPPAMPGVKGAASILDGAAALGRSLSQPVAATSAVSKSQLGYFRRVKEKVAKQSSKNKDLLAETMVISLGEGVEGYSKEVNNVMGVASVMGMTWGGDDNKLLDLLSARERKAKGMRELKNLDCPMSLVKSRRRRGGLCCWVFFVLFVGCFRWVVDC
jgi:hypothetical protein